MIHVPRISALLHDQVGYPGPCGEAGAHVTFDISSAALQRCTPKTCGSKAQATEHARQGAGTSGQLVNIYLLSAEDSYTPLLAVAGLANTCKKSKQTSQTIGNCTSNGHADVNEPRLSRPHLSVSPEHRAGCLSEDVVDPEASDHNKLQPGDVDTLIEQSSGEVARCEPNLVLVSNKARLIHRFFYKLFCSNSVGNPARGLSQCASPGVWASFHPGLLPSLGFKSERDFPHGSFEQHERTEAIVYLESIPQDIPAVRCLKCTSSDYICSCEYLLCAILLERAKHFSSMVFKLICYNLIINLLL